MASMHISILILIRRKVLYASDRGKSIAYIDDFEGANILYPVGISYTAWKDISVPDQLPFTPDTLTKIQLLNYKAKEFLVYSYSFRCIVLEIYGVTERKLAKKR
jgi:hypothetical protein